MITVTTPIPAPPVAGHRPPGERYYRHPGDVVRVIVAATASLLLVLLIELATATSDGLRTDLASAATAAPLALRQLLLACAQVAAVLVPLAIVAALAGRRRWRRLATVAVAAAAGALLAAAVDALLDTPPLIAGALTDEAWLTSTRFPSLVYVGAAVAAAAAVKPWLSRRWRRAADVSLVVLLVTMALAGIAGAPELALAASVGALAGSILLVAVGAPNRRPTPAAIVDALATAGLDVERLDLRRATGGRSQLYRAVSADPTFLKVYGQDSRDADLLFRTYRSAILRDPGGAGSSSLARDVEHEALLLLVAERAGISCPSLRTVVALPDGSMVLAMVDVDGLPLDQLPRDQIDAGLLVAVWREVAALHAAGVAHGSLRAANVLVGDGPRPVLIDFGAGTSAAGSRAQALDRAELIASLAACVGADAAVAAAATVLDADDLAAAMPYLQPLALSAATRRAAKGATLKELRTAIAETTAREPLPLERLVRVRPRTVVMTITLTGAFYILLPQLANVDDSVAALGHANWAWLAAAIVMSGLTYVAAGIGMIGGVREDLPFTTTVEVALASSFVNRVTPANVGGMALNVRYMQKAGVPPAEAVTGVGLNVLAGGVVHVGLLAAFLAWAGRSGAGGFSIPASSKLLVAIVVVLALAGAALATRWGRRIVRAHVLPPLRQSLGAVVSVSRSPLKVAALFGGSVGVTLAYIGALSFSIMAFDGGISFAQAGAVYLGASLLAAAAPTPGGLGAMEAALVAGLTGVGMDPAIAVAVVLSYRLLTFWLPILPGWLCFQWLDRKNYI